MEKKKSQWETIKRVLKYTKKYNIYIAFSLILAAVTVVLTLYLPILTGNAVDLMLGKDAVKFTGLMAILKMMVVIIAFTALAQWLMNICNNKITYNVVRDIRKDAFEKIQILPLKYIDGHPSGDVVSRVIADADQFADGLLMGFTQAFTGSAYDTWNAYLYVKPQCMDNTCRCNCNAVVIFCCEFYCEKDIYYV